jgi:arabinan endo-1,5-alpha-L-arabinosidase
MASRFPRPAALCLTMVLMTLFAVHADTSFDKFNSSAPLDGEVFILVSLQSGRCLSVSGASEHRGANIVLGALAANAGPSERWRLLRHGDHYYKLVNENSGKVLAVPEDSRESGTQMIQWHEADFEGRLWKFVKAGNHFTVESKVNGLVLDVLDGNTESGASVIQWPRKKSENDNQVWFVQWVPGLGRKP